VTRHGRGVFGLAVTADDPTKVLGGTRYQPFNVQRQYTDMLRTGYGESRQNPYSHQQAAIL
jgi:hypothetical protein